MSTCKCYLYEFNYPINGGDQSMKACFLNVDDSDPSLTGEAAPSFLEDKDDGSGNNPYDDKTCVVNTVTYTLRQVAEISKAMADTLKP